MVLGMVGEVMTHASNSNEQENLIKGIPSLARTLEAKFLQGERFMFGW